MQNALTLATHRQWQNRDTDHEIGYMCHEANENVMSAKLQYDINPG